MYHWANGVSMKKKSQLLSKVLAKVDELPNDWFGEESASFEDLPYVSAKQKKSGKKQAKKNRQETCICKACAKIK